MLDECLNWFKLSSNIFYEKNVGPTSSNINASSIFYPTCCMMLDQHVGLVFLGLNSLRKCGSQLKLGTRINETSKSQASVDYYHFFFLDAHSMNLWMYVCVYVFIYLRIYSRSPVIISTRLLIFEIYSNLSIPFPILIPTPFPHLFIFHVLISITKTYFLNFLF